MAEELKIAEKDPSLVNEKDFLIASPGRANSGSSGNLHESTMFEPPQLLSGKQESPSSQPSKYSKHCALCQRPCDVLIRCQIDKTQKWHLICTGKCWKEVSGGVVDGDGNNSWYKYGGMWKNKHDGVSAKIKGKAKVKNRGKGLRNEETGRSHEAGDA